MRRLGFYLVVFLLVWVALYLMMLMIPDPTGAGGHLRLRAATPTRLTPPASASR
jgi:hypothetical protein